MQTAGTMISRRRIRTRVSASPRGRKALGLIAAYRRVWADAPDMLTEPHAWERAVERGDAIAAQVERMADEVAVRSVRGVADMIDAAILACWCDEAGAAAAMLAGVLE